MHEHYPKKISVPHLPINFLKYAVGRFHHGIAEPGAARVLSAQMCLAVVVSSPRAVPCRHLRQTGGTYEASFAHD